VQRISELQRDKAWVPAGTPESADIDLSLLTACLCPSEQVRVHTGAIPASISRGLFRGKGHCVRLCSTAPGPTQSWAEPCRYTVCLRLSDLLFMLGPNNLDRWRRKTLMRCGSPTACSLR
jgi:hypothetical protein